jgi:hypothetical protein
MHKPLLNILHLYFVFIEPVCTNYAIGFCTDFSRNGKRYGPTDLPLEYVTFTFRARVTRDVLPVLMMSFKPMAAPYVLPLFIMLLFKTMGAPDVLKVFVVLPFKTMAEAYV